MPDPDFRTLCAALCAALEPAAIAADGFAPIAALLPQTRAALAAAPQSAPPLLT